LLSRRSIDARAGENAIDQLIHDGLARFATTQFTNSQVLCGATANGKLRILDAAPAEFKRGT
jgi:hypothetical protein